MNMIELFCKAVLHLNSLEEINVFCTTDCNAAQQTRKANFEQILPPLWKMTNDFCGCWKLRAQPDTWTAPPCLCKNKENPTQTKEVLKSGSVCSSVQLPLSSGITQPGRANESALKGIGNSSFIAIGAEFLFVMYRNQKADEGRALEVCQSSLQTSRTFTVKRTEL